MTVGTPVRTVAAVLADVERWKADEEARHKAEMVEVEQEVKNLQTAIANLQQQLEALTKFRAELDGKASALGGQEVQRAYGALFDALADQARRLVEREMQVAAVVKERRASLSKKLAESELATTVQEYQQYRQTVEPTIQNLPASYRQVLLSHHQSNVDKLRDAIAALTAGPVEVEADAIDVDVVYAVDAPEGTPELLLFVLPVDEAVHASWADREDGLQLWLASRVVQAVHEAAAKAGFVRVQPMAGGHRGLLVIELDLGGAPDGFVAALEARLGEVLAKAPELGGAKVKAQPRRVEVDYVLPPEEDEGGE